MGKLAGVGSVPLAFGVSDKCQVTGDRWHATHDTWHMTCDIWHLTRDTWNIILLYFSFPFLSVCFCPFWYWCYYNRELKVESTNWWYNDQLVILNWELVFLEVGRLPIPHPKNTNPQFKITNWKFYHQLVIFTFSSLLFMLRYSVSPICRIFAWSYRVYTKFLFFSLIDWITEFFWITQIVQELRIQAVLVYV